MLIAIFHCGAALAPRHFHYLRLVPGLRPKLCLFGDGYQDPVHFQANCCRIFVVLLVVSTGMYVC